MVMFFAIFFGYSLKQERFTFSSFSFILCQGLLFFLCHIFILQFFPFFPFIIQLRIFFLLLLLMSARDKDIVLTVKMQFLPSSLSLSLFIPFFLVLGIELRAQNILGQCPTTQLHSGQVPTHHFLNMLRIKKNLSDTTLAQLLYTPYETVFLLLPLFFFRILALTRTSLSTKEFKRSLRVLEGPPLPPPPDFWFSM